MITKEALEELGRMIDYKTIYYSEHNQQKMAIVIDIDGDLYDYLTDENKDGETNITLIKLENADKEIVETMKENLEDDKCFSKALKPHLLRIEHNDTEEIDYILTYRA